MSPRQTEIANAAEKLVMMNKPAHPVEITRIVEPKQSGVSGKPYPAAVARTRSVIDALKKKGAWPYDESYNPSGEYPTTPPPNDPIPFRESIFCNLHPSEEDSVHDFGIKVLEEFQKLPRTWQSKLWENVAQLLDQSMHKI
jgi:hypothetical protein